MSGKLLRVAVAFAAIGWWILCFIVNFNASARQAYGLKLFLTAALFVFLLLLSFLSGKHEGYISLVSAYFGLVLITTLSAYLTREIHSVWKLIFLDLPSLTFLVPFTPVFYLQDILQEHWVPFTLIFMVYFCLLAAYFFGRRFTPDLQGGK